MTRALLQYSFEDYWLPPEAATPLPTKANKPRSPKPSRPLPAEARLRVAFSGGLDSTALVAALAALAPVRGFDVRAVHVHHGLQGQADEWVAATRQTAADLGVAFQVRHWEGAPAAGDSEEAAARAARYRLLEAEVAAGDWLMTAHQADDQAETVLLFLARGAGLDGLTGIEARRAFGEKLDRFEEFRKHYDPQNRLLNDYFRRMLGAGQATEPGMIHLAGRSCTGTRAKQHAMAISLGCFLRYGL